MFAGIEATPEPTPVPSATPVDSDLAFANELDQLFTDPEVVLRRYGVDVEGLTNVDITGAGLIQALVAMAIVVLILRSIYRGMQHPRLALQEHPDAPPSVRWPAVRRYLWTPLVLIPLWYLAILAVLVVAANRGGTVRPPLELVVAAAVVVGASRLLAHVNLEAAHELAKSVPLTLISLILISGQTVSLMGAVVLTLSLFLLGGSVVVTLFWLAVCDAVITFTWFFYQRRAWRRRDKREPYSSAQTTWVRRVWRRLARAWGSGSAGPSPRLEVASNVPTYAGHAADISPLDVQMRRIMLLPDPPSTAESPDHK